MRCEKNRRALICYAGSAPEASIGSKPLGSELVVFICTLIAKCQHFVEYVAAIFTARFPGPSLQKLDKKKELTISTLHPEGDKN